MYYLVLRAQRFAPPSAFGTISTNTVKPVLSGHPQSPCKCPLNRGVCLIQARFTENKEEKIRAYLG